MGHVVLAVLHLVAVLFLLPALFVTIPAHVIYVAVKPKPAGTDSSAPLALLIAVAVIGAVLFFAT